MPIETTRQSGASAEDVAAAYLRRHGYQLIVRNYRCRAGELDIIAIDRDTLVFVEVRSRRDREHGGAVAMIDARKRVQVERVARAYLARNPTALSRVRFDIVAITGDDVQLLRDAWRPRY